MAIINGGEDSHPLRRSKPYQWYEPYLLVFLVFAFFCAFSVFPVLFDLVLAFFDWNMMSPPTFVGLGNFAKAIARPSFLAGATNSFIFAFVVQPIVTIIGLSLALFLNDVKDKRVRNFFVAALILPFIVPISISANVWRYGFYDALYGLFNDILARLGLRGLAWLNDPRTSVLSIALINIWQFAGYHMLIYLAGLQAIPEEYYQAAEVDGASSWTKFRRITVPLLKSVFLFVIVMATIGGLQVFTEVYMLTSGGPGYSSITLGYDIYVTAFAHFDYGEACAIGIMLAAVIMIISLVEMKVLEK